ncbi:hypothetical protein JCM3774_000673 [Rhodotorula dairenensis]
MSAISTAQASKSFLSQCDDLLTRLILDYSIFGIPKLDGRATGKIEDAREPRMTDRELDETRELVRQLRKGVVKVDDALASLLKLTPVRNFVKKWEDEEAAAIFANHAKRYILALRPDSGISFHETDRYKNPRGDKSRKGKKPVAVDTPARRDPATFIEVGVFATRNFKKGEVVNLRGGIADLTEEEDDEMRDSGGRRDFSVLWSQRKNCFCLLLGPARFVNHDCRNNVEFQLVGANMTFKVLEDIAKDEEIFTHYGSHYFDQNNAACLCATCEELAQGAFMSKKKVAAPKARAVPTAPPSRRSHRSATLSAPDYNEARAQSAPIASGSGHATTATRSVRSSGMTRSSSLSALSGSSSPRGVRIRPPSSRIIPVRGETSAVDALRNKPRGVVQPKLPPPPGYADDYTWDQKKRVARYIGPAVSSVDQESHKKKPTSGLAWSASAPSLASLGKRKREESNSPAPRSRVRTPKQDSSAPPSPKKSRLAQVKLKAVRLGVRMSSRLAGAATASGASARDRKFALLSKAMGDGEGADDSDLSSLDEEDEDEASAAAEEHPVDADSDEEAEEAAVEQQLLSPQRSASLASTSALSDAPSTSISLVVSSSSSRAQATSRSRLAELSQTTSTPVEEVGSPSLHAPSEAGEEDEVLLCPVPGGKPALLAPAPSFYAAGPSKPNGASLPNDKDSAVDSMPDFRLGRSDLDVRGSGSAGQGISANGGSGGDEEDDGDRRPPKRAVPVDAEDDSVVVADSDAEQGEEQNEDGGQGKGGAIALTGGVQVAPNSTHVPSPPTLLRADSLGSNDSRDAAAALLLLLCAPTEPTISGTPPEEPSSRESSDPSQAPRKKSRRSEVAAPNSAARQPKPESSGTSRRSTRLSHGEASIAAPPRTNAEPPALESRRTRSQPIVGKLQDVLSAPETLAAIGGYDWAKGKYISTKEALNNPSDDPRPPPRESSESASPSPPPPPAQRPHRSANGPVPSKPPRLTPLGSRASTREPPKRLSAPAATRERAAKRPVPAQNDAQPKEPPVSPRPTPLPPGGRSTRRSFPMANMKVADLVYSPAARQATGGWDPVLGKYVSATHSAPPEEPSTPSTGPRAEQQKPKRPPLPDGKRATRRSFPMANTTLSDLVYSREARAAAGGWDPVLGRYVSASNAHAGPSSTPRR